MLIAADLPRLGFLCILSNKFWSLVYEWTVSRWPFTISYLSFTILRIGAIQFVVHEAAEKISISSTFTSLLFIPYTIFGISVPGAVSKTFLIPFDFRWHDKASLDLNAPVLSIKRAFFIPYFS